MHVLQRIHRWLRPGGRVLDIHPEPEAASVEVAANGSLTRIGSFDRPAIYDKIRAARTALAELVDVLTNLVATLDQHLAGLDEGQPLNLDSVAENRSSRHRRACTCIQTGDPVLAFCRQTSGP